MAKKKLKDRLSKPKWKTVEQLLKEAQAKGSLEPVILRDEIPEEERWRYRFNKKAKKRDLEERYQFSIEAGVSAKKNWFTYRDHKTGRYVKKSELDNCTKGVRMELWRYSKNAEHKFKMLWKEKRYTFLKKARSLERERVILRNFYRRNKSRFVWDKDLKTWIAFTRSP